MIAPMLLLLLAALRPGTPAPMSAAGPPVRSIMVGSRRIVLGATLLSRAARLMNSPMHAAGPGRRSTCITTADRGVVLMLEGAANGPVGSFSLHTVTDSAEISGCTRLRLREREIATGDGLKIGRLKADVTHLMGPAPRDSAGVSVYDWNGPWQGGADAAPAAPAPAARGRARAAAAPAGRTASGSLRVEYQGDSVTGLSGSLTISGS